jgi:hypothetical protein
MHEHARMWMSVLEILGLKPIIHCSNPNIWSTLWVSGDKGLLFLLNLFSAYMEAEVSIALPNGKFINTGVHQIGPVTVIGIFISFV